MKKLILAASATLVLAGCASTNSDYEFGDLTNGVLTMQAEYCATADPRARALRLAALRAAGVPIPPSGACADIISLVPDVQIDTDETEADRERFDDVNRDTESDTE